MAQTKGMRAVDVRKANGGFTFSPRSNNKLVCNQHPELGKISVSRAASLNAENLVQNKPDHWNPRGVGRLSKGAQHKRPGRQAAKARRERARKLVGGYRNQDSMYKY